MTTRLQTLGWTSWVIIVCLVMLLILLAGASYLAE